MLLIFLSIFGSSARMASSVRLLPMPTVAEPPDDCAVPALLVPGGGAVTALGLGELGVTELRAAGLLLS